MPEPFDGRAILEVLHRHRVDCIVVGGFAATMYGSPFPTDDVDVVPADDLANFERLSEALEEMEAGIRVNDVPDPLPFSHDGRSLAGMRVLDLRTKFGNFDITVVPSGTTGYEDLQRDAVGVTLGGTPVVIASLADIVRSKSAANRDKDRRVLPVLRELLARGASLGRLGPEDGGA